MRVLAVGGERVTAMNSRPQQTSERRLQAGGRLSAETTRRRLPTQSGNRQRTIEPPKS